MNIQVEITEDGLVKVTDPELRGKKISLPFSEKESPEFVRETDWDAIKEIFRKADSLDFPRRTHEEIIRDLHELRG